MIFKSWDKIEIVTDNGSTVKAVTPIIISASRSTDIPAFYSKWFFNRLNKGYLVWINPFNQSEQFISFKNCRLVVFWTKYAAPIIPYLHILNDQNINFYFHYTLNDYDKSLEPNVPSLDKRIENFINLSQKIGKERLIWRFDPLILTDEINIDTLIDKIYSLGIKLKEHTNKLVISFADIKVYRKVQNNLKRKEIKYSEFTPSAVNDFARKLMQINQELKLKIATCAENVDLFQYGIEKNRCIDDELIVQEFSHDKKLMSFLGVNEDPQVDMFNQNNYSPNKALKDKGQRKACGCIISKDIGMYNTCNHLCTYCYANHSDKTVQKNINRHDPEYHSIINPNKTISYA